MEQHSFRHAQEEHDLTFNMLCTKYKISRFLLLIFGVKFHIWERFAKLTKLWLIPIGEITPEENGTQKHLTFIVCYPVHIVFYGTLYSFHFSNVQCFSTYWPLPPALVYRCVIVKSLSIFTPRRIRIYRIFTGASGSSNRIPSLNNKSDKILNFTSRAATWSGDAVVRLQSISFPWPLYLGHHDIVTYFS